MCVINYYHFHIQIRSMRLSLNHVHSWHCAATTQDSTRFVYCIFQSFSILPGCPSPSCHVLYLRSWKQTNLPLFKWHFICIYKSLIIRLFAFGAHGFELIILYNSLQSSSFLPGRPISSSCIDSLLSPMYYFHLLPLTHFLICEIFILSSVLYYMHACSFVFSF